MSARSPIVTKRKLAQARRRNEERVWIERAITADWSRLLEPRLRRRLEAIVAARRARS